MSTNQVVVTIANRQYPLKLTSSEEERVKKAEEKIRLMIAELENNYRVTDKQDLLAMCLLQIASEGEKQIAQNEEFVKTIEAKTQQLVSGITEYINSTNVL